jgi:hypothetical protein
MKVLYLSLLVFAASVASTGCNAGYDHVLFTTRSNVGIDIDTKPPNTEIAISRSEFVIAPTFENGKVPPVSASFRSEASGFSDFFFGVSQTFATGEAAVAMTALYDAGDARIYMASNGGAANGGNGGGQPAATHPGSGEVKYDTATDDPRKIEFGSYKGEEINVKPTRKGKRSKPADGSTVKKVNLLEQGEVKPVVFGTDTSFGLKVGWDVATGTPESIKLGFNRKEFAWAPVTLEDTTTSTAPDNTGPYLVSIPSLLATIDMNSGVGDQATGASYKWLQYFATGKSATNLALRKAVRDAMLKRSDPAAFALNEAFETSTNSESTLQLLVDITIARDQYDEDLVKDQMKPWLESAGLGDVKTEDFIFKPDYEKQRQAFIATYTTINEN